MANVSRTTRAGKDGTIVTALRNKVLGLDQLPLGGRIYTQAEAADLIERRIAAGNAVDQARAAWLAAIKEYEDLSAQVDVVERDLRHVVMGAFGETSPRMADFDFAPPKRRVLTPEQIQAAVQKRNATRKLRKTMGRKQKKAIKGVVPASASASPGVQLAMAGVMSGTAPAVPAGVDATSGGAAMVATQGVPVEPGLRGGAGDTSG